MYCCGDPQVHTVSGETFSKLGVDIENYVYTGMWAGPPRLDGTYDVDDSVTAMIRTAGPVITVNGAWAENIEGGGSFIDFIGDKAGIRLQYGGGFTIFGVEGGKLTEVQPPVPKVNMFQEEINAFIRCIQTGEKLPSHIDTVIITAQMMQAIYDSGEKHREIVL